LERDTEHDGTGYQRLCKAAKKAPNLPSGKQLRPRVTAGDRLCRPILARIWHG
jgi:hypothetical protein